ncbi:DUF5107 domain-containing protein [Stigmatella erecta]|uniref:Tetratricopeptide repeat-containing protein n=1 Tax=Stigmatella erecta TaxID=83460 RepID=A0A1I0L538_9BACT|nr:DUF5107 domain-containing protein [Stigmatella erecta]SEU34578.1 Tetratricopeptide repeat-containing protein [Stigmatella erecta]
MSPVSVRRATVELPTYAPQAPDRNPMFLEKRVYQGSSGRIYPLPFIDRIAEEPVPRPWEAVFLENEYLQLMLLPQLGGRIHRAVDKTHGFDMIYYQPVIKPALVGLAGPWISGGIEFNWPQHHRPSTFMPADVHVEQEPDGAITVWMSEHDPMARMKGMHGVRLRPGSAVLELRVRVYNRTADVQTFLWWANVAVRVHERYQSFFPPDVSYVADHAKRAMSTYPRASGPYYGVDYAARARKGVPAQERPPRYPPDAADGFTPPSPDDLSWYANIPVPTSYMCMGTKEDFFGGYDHRARAGIVHVADHHIAPGKKQWTWGNHAFGYAWDRLLTDPDANGEHAPYIELMAGVFTDNQPDFSFLQPGETKTWSQSWYPIREVGPVQQANLDAAVHLSVQGTDVKVGVAAPAPLSGVRIRLEAQGRVLKRWTRELGPDRPFTAVAALPPGTRREALTVSVRTKEGRELVRYTPPPPTQRPLPEAATEPPLPTHVESADALYLTGLHLEQYRHATRAPEAYWREALRRDPGDARCHTALGRWHLRRGELAEAEKHLRAAVARLTARNPNPADGEAHYQLGRCLRLRAWEAREGAAPTLRRDAEEALHKAAWNQAWRGASALALAELACQRQDWRAALSQAEESLRLDAQQLRARDLRALILRQLGRDAEASEALADTLRMDPLDWWARDLRGETLACDNQVRLDLAWDYAHAGFYGEARRVLEQAPPAADGTAPLLAYTRAFFHEQEGQAQDAKRLRRAAREADPAYCFPARLEELFVLRAALRAEPSDARAPFFLGHLLYDRRRHGEAIVCWERAARQEPGNAIAWRNLGIAYYNVRKQPTRARTAYERAFRANPGDARLLFERDQLWKRLGVAPRRRLRELERHLSLVRRRDDLSIELCALYNQTGQAAQAQEVLASRRFQPWEGGEGLVLGQHLRTHLLLGRAALAAGRVEEARKLFEVAGSAPAHLGEARHLLANPSELGFWMGEALAASGDPAGARRAWQAAASFRGDFQQMAVQPFSEMTYWSALASARLGKKAESKRLLKGLLEHAQALAWKPAVIDYFATSLPAMLLFDEELAFQQETAALFLEAQARSGLGQNARARRILTEVLRREPGHALAQDLLGEWGR